MQQLFGREISFGVSGDHRWMHSRKADVSSIVCLCTKLALGISGMDGLAMCKKCSPAVIRSLRMAATESVPRAAPVNSPGFHQRRSRLSPHRGVRTCSSSLGFNPASAPAGFTDGQRTRGDREKGWDKVSPVLHSFVPAPSHPQPALTPGEGRLSRAGRCVLPTHQCLTWKDALGMVSLLLRGVPQPVPNPKTSGQGWGKEVKHDNPPQAGLVLLPSH